MSERNEATIRAELEANQLADSARYHESELFALLADLSASPRLPKHGQWREDPGSATESYLSCVEGGDLYVWLGRTTTRPGGPQWYYGLELGHLGGGAHPLDQPEFMVDYEILSRPAASKVDAQFKALRACARWEVVLDAREWEMTAIMAGDPEDPNPDWWKA